MLHGAHSYLLQDDGGPDAGDAQHLAPGWTTRAWGRSTATTRRRAAPSTSRSTDEEALDGFQLLAETEGILPALESAHAIAYAAKLAPTLPPEAIIVICLSGRGDKDMEVVAQALGLSLPGARQ